MERVVAVEVGGRAKAYPQSATRRARVISDRVGAQRLVIFHDDGAVSALDAARIEDSREVGSTGVFDPVAAGRPLTFRYVNGRIADVETGSTWNVLGLATDGPLKGARLRPLPHGDYFAFAWFAFRPDTAVFGR